MTKTVYAVVRDTYGSYTLPKGIWREYEQAVNQAIALSGQSRSKYQEKPSDSCAYEGVIEAGTESWRIYEYEIDEFEESHIDSRDAGTVSPVESF